MESIGLSEGTKTISNANLSRMSYASRREELTGNPTESVRRRYDFLYVGSAEILIWLECFLANVL